MDKKYFALKLNPCRPDFVQKMSDTERDIMQQHVTYWKKYMAEGMVLIFGPVFDPRGAYGLGIVSANNEAQVNEFIKKDPASAINTYAYYPMRAVVPEK